MIGPKKLSTIRKEIEQALAAPGEDAERHLRGLRHTGQRVSPVPDL